MNTEKYSNILFHTNLSSLAYQINYGQTWHKNSNCVLLKDCKDNDHIKNLKQKLLIVFR